MFVTDPWFWGTVALLIIVLVFGIPRLVSWFNPLIQLVNEPPHHLFFMTGHQRKALAGVMRLVGHKPFGVFVSGANQLLFRNGSTVFAIRESGMPCAALIAPVKGMSLDQAVRESVKILESYGFTPRPEPVPHMEDRIIRFRLEDQLGGYDVGLRLQGRKMAKYGMPAFTRW